MKKDKFISEKLNNLADDVKLDSKVIEDAVTVCQNQVLARKTPFRKKLMFSLAAGAAALALIILIYPFLSSAFNTGGGHSVPSYSLNEMQQKSVPSQGLTFLTEKEILPFTKFKDNFNPMLPAYEYNNEISVIIFNFLIVSDYAMGNSEITIYADICNNLTDFSHYKNFEGIFRTQETNFIYKETFKDGEYLTNGYFSYNGIDYYLKIVSPVQNAFKDNAGDLLFK